ncbi:MAG: DNA methyltransferase, partial [Gammaproteobacteria bacterium]|nr:DNA methyltransferase [Gammaproteobacteria bacterium]
MAKRTRKRVETLLHGEASRRNIPTAEHEPVMAEGDRSPIEVAYERRNRDLDPQLVWRGKDEQNWSDLVVQAPPLFIQEKVHPKALINDLLRHSQSAEAEKAAREAGFQIDLFADFNGLPSEDARTEFYQHDANWSNRMILGDSLQVMASLAEREGLRGKVQCIYLDPPYGIKFNSNFQWSTTSRDVKDGKAEHISREPEQVKAFRDTWRDGIHSYLTYLRDRLTVARDLLADSGSIFVQIGDENVHRVRALMDEVFGPENFLSLITFKTSIGLGAQHLDNTCNYILAYCRDIEQTKFRPLFRLLEPWAEGATRYKTVRLPNLIERRVSSDELKGNELLPEGSRLFRDQGFTSRSASSTTLFSVDFRGEVFRPGSGGWRTSKIGLRRSIEADRVLKTGSNISFRKYFDDFGALELDNFWVDVTGGITSRSDPKVYVVQTSTKIVERCVLMTTDPGDLVLDPTCGSGTTAYVAEQWGRRWITIDTSRVALTLARARVMGARYPYYLLADSPEGQQKEGEISDRVASDAPTHGNIRLGFVYERVPHITLKSIANNAEIDVIWERWQETLEPLRAELNGTLGRTWEEWEIPRESGDPWPDAAVSAWHKIRSAGTDAARAAALRSLNKELNRQYTFEEVPDSPRDSWGPDATDLHARWWEARIARQQEVDASIAAKADFEYLYDKPYEDRKRVRVAGPFTVESVSPHRVLDVNEDDELVDRVAEARLGYGKTQDFTSVILEHLKTSGVQQAHKEDRITFSSVIPWPGDLVCAEGRYVEGDEAAGTEKRAAIFVGPEFGTVSRPDLVAAAREAADAGFDVLVTCAFNYEAHASDFRKLGRVPVLKARMNADLHMAGDLKNTGKGNLFVVFGEPDIDILPVKSGEREDERFQVRIKGVDVFHPNS